MKSIIALAVLSICCTDGLARCWTVGEFKGVSVSKSDAYKMVPDGFGKYAPAVFIVSTEGRGMVSNHDDMRCTTMSPAAVMCVAGDSDRATLEVWTVDEARGIAVFTRTRSGFGEHDGANLFVGKVLGRCTRQ